MKILVLNWRDVSHPKSGGAEIVTMEHAKQWVKMGHSVVWLTAGYTGALSSELIDGVNIIRKAGSLSIYFYVPGFILMNGIQYDVIVDEVHGFPFFAPLFTKKPVVMFIHEIAGEIWDYMFTFPKNVIGKYLEKWYFKVYKHCLFWTDAHSTVEEIAAHGIDIQNCLAIPCPIIPDTNLSQDATNSKEQVPTYIFVSRVVRMKGIEEVIKAFSFIVMSQPEAKLWIVGGGEAIYIEELQKMLHEYSVTDSVEFLGQISQKEKFTRMKKSHILLHASVKEGWGLVVLEAASVGTPAVVYNVHGLRDVVKNGVTGVVVSQNSPREMAKEALELYGDRKRYSEMQKNAKIWVDSLSWPEVARQSLKFLQKAIDRI